MPWPSGQAATAPSRPDSLVPPRDLTAALFKVRSTPSGSLPTDLDLFATLSRGMHGTDMAPWTRLSERQRWALVAHLKALSPRFRSEEPEAAVQVLPPVASEAVLTRRGEALYARLQCGNCHGPAGFGDGPGAAQYANEPETVRIRDLARAYFVRGDAPEDIYLSLRTGLDGTPMGAFDLPSEDLWSTGFLRARCASSRARPAAATTCGGSGVQSLGA